MKKVLISPHISRLLSVFILLVLSLLAVLVNTPATYAATRHTNRSAAQQDSCLQVTYNQHTYYGGDTLPPFPVNINFTVSVDWSGCVYSNFDPFGVVVGLAATTGGTPLTSASYICYFQTPFSQCDGFHAFGFKTSQVVQQLSVQWFDGSDTSGAENATYQATLAVDSGSCTHAFVQVDNSSLYFSVDQAGKGGVASATVWELFAETPQSTYTACYRFYAKVTYDSTGGLAGKGAVWLYTHSNDSYLASAPTPYIAAGTHAISGFTNTVYSSSGVDVKLGVAGPSSSSPYIISTYDRWPLNSEL